MRISDWSSDVCSSDLQRKAVELGQLQCADGQGLSLARQFAMLSYRTPQEFEQRFNAAPELVHGRVRVAAEDYLDAIGARYVGRTPVTAFLRLSESIDLQRVDPAQERIPTTVVAVEGDRSEEHTSELQSLMRISYAV